MSKTPGSRGKGRCQGAALPVLGPCVSSSRHKAVTEQGARTLAPAHSVLGLGAEPVGRLAFLLSLLSALLVLTTRPRDCPGQRAVPIPTWPPGAAVEGSLPCDDDHKSCVF